MSVVEQRTPTADQVAHAARCEAARCLQDLTREAGAAIPETAIARILEVGFRLGADWMREVMASGSFGRLHEDDLADVEF